MESFFSILRINEFFLFSFGRRFSVKLLECLKKVTGERVKDVIFIHPIKKYKCLLHCQPLL